MGTRIFRSDASSFGVDLLAAAVDPIVSACRKARRLETGGILLGYYSECYDHAIVVEALGPPKDSRAGSSWFQRGTAGVEAVLRARWRASPPLYYLGEWHFHPLASARPSGEDLGQMAEIAADHGYRCPEPILVILGGDPDRQWDISSTIVRRGGSALYLTPRHSESGKEL